jgi:cobalt-zinc-cadmium efflux system membrane fusion protein
VLGASALLAGCGDSKGVSAGDAAGAAATSDASPPLVLATVTVTTRAFERVIKASGAYVADDSVTVRAKVPGRVLHVGPEVGDAVPGGVELVRIEEIDYQLVHAQRLAQLAESLRRLALQALPEGEPDFELLPAIERARLEAANAQERYERGVSVRASTPGALSLQDVNNLKTAWDVAESGLRAARLAAAVELAQARTREAEVRIVEQQLRDLLVRAPPMAAPGATAPGSWHVAERLVAVGDFVQTGQALYRLVDVDPIRLVLRIPEQRLAGVSQGRVTHVLGPTGERLAAGQVTRLRPEVDPSTRSRAVEVDLPNPDARLAPGGFAVAEVVLGEDADVPCIPAASVVWFAGSTKVFQLVEGRAREARVTLGRTDGAWVEVVSGLKPGAVCVAQPPASLLDGRRVTPAPEGKRP